MVSIETLDRLKVAILGIPVCIFVLNRIPVIFFFVVNFMCCFEYYSITKTSRSYGYIIPSIPNCLIFFSPEFFGEASIFAILLIVYFSSNCDGNILANVIACSLFITLPLSCWKYFTTEYIILSITVAWLNDAGSYFGGKHFGTTKCIPRVSPNKTVEGYMIGSVVSLVFGTLAKVIFFPQSSTLLLICIWALSVTIGNVGDLLESYFKRCNYVKDSGTTLSRHGGFLDRFDSVIACFAFGGFVVSYLQM